MRIFRIVLLYLIKKFKNDNKLARIRESAKTETAANDLSQHYDDVSYTNVYNELLNTDEVASAGPMEAVRKSKEFNRIYEMGIEEEILPHNIKSDIFTPEQVRRIYTAGVVDDNANNYNKQLDFDEVLNEYETKAALSIFGDETVKNIMTASAEQVRAVGKKLGVNVVFGDTVPGDDPNAPGAYDPDTNTIYINKNTKYPMQQIFLHELTHFFEKAENYLEFQKSVFNSKAFKRWLKRKTQIKNFKSFNSLEEYRKEIGTRYGETDPDEIDREIVAYFVSDNLFQKDFGDIGRLVTELKGSKKEKFISFMKNIFKKFKNAITGINKLEKKFLKLYDSAMQNKNTDNNGGVKQMAILELENGNTIVKATRNIIFGNDVKAWRKQITNFFNNLLRNNKSLTVTTIEGDKLTITKSETANKARDRYKTVNGKTVKMSDNEFKIKLNVESHIDEVVTVSKSQSKEKSEDIKSHGFAKDGFTYRTAYFEDYDGQLYKITLSVGHNGEIATVYNVGRIEKRQSVARNKISVRGSNESAHDTLSNTNISQNDNGVNNNSMQKSKNNSKIQNMLSSEDTDINGFVLEENEDGDEMQESLRGQRAITYDDIKLIPEIVSNPDEVKLDTKLYEGKPVLKFIKTINGKTTVVTYVSNKHKDLSVQTMYSGKNKKGNLAAAADEQASANTPEANVGTVTSTNSITNSSENVKESENDSENIKKVKQTKLPNHKRLGSFVLSGAANGT